MLYEVITKPKNLNTMNTKSFKSLFKTIGIVIVLLLVCSQANCQALEPSMGNPQLETYDFHIKKYKTNRTSGTILLITGSVSFVAGAVINFGDALEDAIFEGEGDLGSPSGLFV